MVIWLDSQIPNFEWSDIASVVAAICCWGYCRRSPAKLQLDAHRSAERLIPIILLLFSERVLPWMRRRKQIVSSNKLQKARKHRKRCTSGATDRRKHRARGQEPRGGKRHSRTDNAKAWPRKVAAMGMKHTLAVINQMEADGILTRYAIAGAIAAYNYIEATATDDLDILASFDRSPGLISLTPIYSYLKAKGYEEHHGEGIVIEGWPVQFLPVADALDAEALANAVEIEMKFPGDERTVKTRVLRPEHVVATALRVGRPKDFGRIAQFLNEAILDLGTLCDVLGRHGLVNAWRLYCARAGIADPCRVQGQP
jgi:hypothetical protein